MERFKILIIEDNATFRQTLSETLLSQFPSLVIEEAGDGKEGAQKIDQLLPDLIFIDIKLPGENGLQLTQKIKKKYPQTVIIILTSYDLLEYREAAFQFGANHFVVKGLGTYDEILLLVESILTAAGFAPNGSKGVIS